MSKLEFKLPDIGEGVSEGEIVSWLVKVGDVVNDDQDMVEVMTDKATVTIGAPKRGKVLELRAQGGDVVPVGQVLIVLDVSADAGVAVESQGAAANREAPEPKPQETSASAVGDIRENLPGTTPPPAVAPAAVAPAAVAPAAAAPAASYFNPKPLAAPVTRKLARELGLDLRNVPPSGTAGRVTQQDVEAFAGNGGAAPSPTVKPQAAPIVVAPIVSNAVDQRVPIRGIRKRIFESMARSKHTAAHFTYVEECECSALIAARNRAKPFAERDGVKLNFLPFIVKAVVAALRRHPMLNTVVDEATMEMVHKGSFDIGIAAATDAGLIVPVLRNADRLNLLEIAREIERLGAEARAGKTRREDLGSSSFTITSLGKLGGMFATPVLNHPEVAILYIPEMKKMPVVTDDDQIAVGHVMHISLSFDHRIVDGHVGAAFAQEVVSYLESPERLLLELR